MSFTDALLLRSVDYRDADRILTFLTRSEGKLSAIARGARNSKKRFSGMQPYMLLRVELGRNRGGLVPLSSATTVEAFEVLLSDYNRMALAGYAMTLVREVMPDQQPDERCFELATEILKVLNETPASESLWLAWSARFVTLAGLSPNLNTCAVSGVRAPSGRAVYFDPNKGGIVSRRQGGAAAGVLLSASARQGLLSACSGDWKSCQWFDEDLAQIREALVAFISSQLGKALIVPSFIG